MHASSTLASSVVCHLGGRATCNQLRAIFDHGSPDGACRVNLRHDGPTVAAATFSPRPGGARMSGSTTRRAPGRS